MPYYSGTYKLKDPGKYLGDPDKVVYRSGWERAAFLWCDKNPQVAFWEAEETIVPYFDKSSNKMRRYFMDLRIVWKDGRVSLREIKPRKETKPPRKKKDRQRYLKEAKTFVTNQCKWQAAENYAKERGWDFAVWTEDELKKRKILRF